MQRREVQTHGGPVGGDRARGSHRVSHIEGLLQLPAQARLMFIPEG